MKLNSPTAQRIEATLLAALRNLTETSNEPPLTDILVQPLLSEGILHVYDDSDNNLAHCELEGVVSSREMEQTLRAILRKLSDGKKLDRFTLTKPYSFVLVDDGKETLTELLLVDDDRLIVTGELLPGLDEELDEFLRKLLEE